MLDHWMAPRAGGLRRLLAGRGALRPRGGVTPREALPFARPELELVAVEAVAEPETAPELPDSPGDPGSLWRDDAGRIRRVPPLRAMGAPLLPAEAARGFVAWLYDNELYGERPFSGPDGIWALYLWHCDEVRITPTASNIFAEALGKALPRRQVTDWASGKRRRITHYAVHPPQAPAEAAEPRRKAA